MNECVRVTSIVAYIRREQIAEIMGDAAADRHAPISNSVLIPRAGLPRLERSDQALCSGSPHHSNIAEAAPITPQPRKAAA